MTETDIKLYASHLKPLGSKVILRKLNANRSYGSIQIPPKVDTPRTQVAEVVAVFEEHTNEKGELIKPTVKVGDLVLITKWAGTEMQIDIANKEENLVAVNLNEIHAIYTKQINKN